MRLSAIESLYRAYAPMGFPLRIIKSKLNLPSEEDAETMTIAAGYRWSYNQKTNKKSFEKRPERDDWMQTWKRWQQSGPLTDLDILRGKVRRSRLIKLGIDAFEGSESEMGKANVLQDCHEILAMPTEDPPTSKMGKRVRGESEQKEIEERLKAI